MSILHIHSALSGKTYNSPKEFEEEVGRLDATLLSADPRTTEQSVKILEALGYTVTFYDGITADSYKALCGKLAAGAYVSLQIGVPGNPSEGHRVVVYGINEYGEMLVADSDNGNQAVGIYDDYFTYALALQNMTGPNSDIFIVEK